MTSAATATPTNEHDWQVLWVPRTEPLDQLDRSQENYEIQFWVWLMCVGCNEIKRVVAEGSQVGRLEATRE